MKNDILERFQTYMKDSLKMMPDIRYFDGTECFSDITGKYKAKTLEDCLNLFLTDEGY